jgi:hypothetical protein
MVIFDLICDSKHEFEGWFKNSQELAEQQQSGLLTCPICDSGRVNKKVSAPKVGKKSTATVLSKHCDGESRNEVNSVSVGGSSAPQTAEFGHLRDMLKKVHDYVEENFEDVGNRFAEEAISMHKGEKEGANIRGTASNSQLQELSEEGITAVPLPDKPIDKGDLN